MRNFIQNAVLHKILDEIENHLGYSISSAPMPFGLPGKPDAAVDVYNGKWLFLYHPGKQPSQTTLCHELMHIILGIEGWPLWASHESIEDGSADENLHDRAIYFPQHVVINARYHIVKSIILGEQRQAKDNSAPPLPLEIVTQVKLHALVAAEIMLSPPDTYSCSFDRNELQRDYPQSWKLADSICREVEIHRPLDRQSGVALVYKIFETLSLPKEILRPLPSGTPYDPQFFDRMLVKIGNNLDGRHTASG